MGEIAQLDPAAATTLVVSHAKYIVQKTQGQEWDDPEEWATEAAELAHAVLRLIPESPPDDCQFCRGAKGNVKGNENVFSGIVVCDDCSILVREILNSHEKALR
jgi:hypothetical protein